MHKLNAHTAEQTGLGCFVAPCAYLTWTHLHGNSQG